MLKKNSVDVYHNIMWSKYKGLIFSELYILSFPAEMQVNVFQISETEGAREALGGVDLSYHRYPFKLLFKGAYEKINRPSLIFTLFRSVLLSRSAAVVLPGYSRIEHWVMLFAALISHKKVGVFCDSTINDRVQKKGKNYLKRQFFKRCDGYVAYGQRSLEYLIFLGAQANRVFQPCQTATLPPSYTVADAKKARYMSCSTDRPPRFLYVGRLAREKGLDSLVDAFAIVRKVYHDAELRIVGNGEMLAALQHKCNEQLMTQAVTFVGSLDPTELTKEYSAATCLILPSVCEPWGLVVNEALHHGCPVIVSEICGCVPELIVEGHTGYTVKVGCSNDLSEKMLGAVTQFGDIECTAGRCISQVARYTPRYAAERLLALCMYLSR